MTLSIYLFYLNMTKTHYCLWKSYFPKCKFCKWALVFAFIVNVPFVSKLKFHSGITKKEATQMSSLLKFILFWYKLLDELCPKTY